MSGRLSVMMGWETRTIRSNVVAASVLHPKRRRMRRDVTALIDACSAVPLSYFARIAWLNGTMSSPFTRLRCFLISLALTPNSNLENSVGPAYISSESP